LLHVSVTNNHHQVDISVHGHDMLLLNILLRFDWTIF